MENISENISENLVKLRKENKLTQQDVGKIFNYSDKAVSRWERGDSLPDIETLSKICDYFGVEFEWLIRKNASIEKSKKSKTNNIYKMAIIMMFALTCYTLATIIFVFRKIVNNVPSWQAFVWATQISLFFCFAYGKNLWNIVIRTVFLSLSMWTLLASIYLQWLSVNIWPIFFLGVPLQCMLILLTFINKTKQTK